jgi:diacylglycerol kinase (ATP)
MRKVLVLKNPEAGNHDSQLLKHSLRKHLTGETTSYQVHNITPGDRIEEVVREHIERGINLCVAAGGDGTIAAVAGGLIGTEIPLGIIPLGTGNMFAREVKIPLDIERATGIIAGVHRFKMVDAMQLEDRIFVLSMGVGISSLAIRDLTRKEKKLFGILSYVGSALKQVIKFRPHHFKLTIDGDFMEVSSPDVSVSNAGIIAEMILPKSPPIEIDDGALDVIYVKADSTKDYPTLIMNVLGRKPPQSSIRWIRARERVTIDAEKPIKVQADGEIVGETPITVKVIPAAFRLIVPPEK